MTRCQLNRINDVIRNLSGAVTLQSNWCKLSHARFDMNSPLDCYDARRFVFDALNTYKKIPLRILGGRKELYLDYLKHPCVWNVHYTISFLSSCVANEEEIESMLDWEETSGIRHSLREAN